MDKVSEKMQIGEKIRRLRADRRMSATSLGKAVKRTTTTILQIEGGDTKDPKVSIVRGIADVLGVSMDWLTDESADWPPASEMDDAKRTLVEALDRVGRTSAEGLAPDAAALLVDYDRLPDAQRAEVRGIVRGMAMSAPAATDTDATARGQAAYDRITDAGRQADDARRGKQEDEKGVAG